MGVFLFPLVQKANFHVPKGRKKKERKDRMTTPCSNPLPLDTKSLMKRHRVAKANFGLIMVWRGRERGGGRNVLGMGDLIHLAVRLVFPVLGSVGGCCVEDVLRGFVAGSAPGEWEVVHGDEMGVGGVEVTESYPSIPSHGTPPRLPFNPPSSPLTLPTQSAQQSHGIATLLEAEKEASKVVQAARQCTSHLPPACFGDSSP